MHQTIPRKVPERIKINIQKCQQKDLKNYNFIPCLSQLCNQHCMKGSSFAHLFWGILTYFNSICFSRQWLRMPQPETYLYFKSCFSFLMIPSESLLIKSLSSTRIRPSCAKFETTGRIGRSSKMCDFTTLLMLSNEIDQYQQISQ